MDRVTPYITAGWAATILGVSRRQITNLAHSGKLAVAGTADTGGSMIYLFDEAVVYALKSERDAAAARVQS